MIIRVTEDHIRRGEPGECGTCPVALALLDAGLKKVYVDGVSICWEQDRFGITQKMHETTPEEVENFICQFDAGGRVEPFEFPLCGEPV